MPTYYTQSESARRLGITRERIRQLIAKEALKVVTVDGRRRITARTLAGFARRDRWGETKRDRPWS